MRTNFIEHVEGWFSCVFCGHTVLWLEGAYEVRKSSCSRILSGCLDDSMTDCGKAFMGCWLSGLTNCGLGLRF